MSQEPPMTTKQLAEALKIPESLVLSFRDQGLLPPTTTSADADADVGEPPRYLRSEVVRSLRQYPEAMTAIRKAMRQ